MKINRIHIKRIRRRLLLKLNLIRSAENGWCEACFKNRHTAYDYRVGRVCASCKDEINLISFREPTQKEREYGESLVDLADKYGPVKIYGVPDSD